MFFLTGVVKLVECHRGVDVMMNRCDLLFVGLEDKRVSHVLYFDIF